MHNGHDHSHTLQLSKIKKAFVIGIVLNLLFVLVEAVAGFIVNSLSLLADAGHNLADVGTMALSLLALRLSQTDSTEKFTYGLGKVSVMAALINSLVLLVSVGVIGYEAVLRFNHPREISGDTIALVAGVGILINGFTAYLFFHERKNDLNVKSSYWHLVADTLVSLAVVVGGVCIYYLNWYWMDSALSLLVAVIILIGSWQVFKESALLGLDAVPKNVRLNSVQSLAKKVSGVVDLHHIHIWALSTNQNAMTAHLVLKEGTSSDEEMKIKNDLKHQLEHENIHHVTLETEHENDYCKFVDC